MGIAARRMEWIAYIVAWCLCADCAFAQQSYPTKSMRLIVPYPPGGGADVMGRVLAEALSARFAQQVVVDNRGGASTTIGADLAAKSPADGYTLFLATVTTLAASTKISRTCFAWWLSVCSSSERVVSDKKQRT